jgi:hypothetical protein
MLLALHRGEIISQSASGSNQFANPQTYIFVVILIISNTMTVSYLVILAVTVSVAY